MRHFSLTWRTLIAFILMVWLLILVYITLSLHQGYSTSEQSVVDHAKDSNIEFLKREIEKKDSIVNKLKQELISKEAEHIVKRQAYERDRQLNNDGKESIEDRKGQRANSSNDLSRFGSLQMSRVEYNVREIWHYFSNNLETKHLAEFKDRMHMLNSDLTDLKSSLGPSGWRQRQFKSLSEKMQNSFTKLQNPENCQNARQLICYLNKICGFGCQMHHLIYCFIVAYGSGRTMILNGKDWQYSTKGWEGTYQPISDSCTKTSGELFEWSLDNQDKQTLKLPLVDFMRYKPKYMPLAVPKSYYKDLKEIHGDPFVWFVGQILKFLLKPNPGTRKLLDSLDKMIADKHPIVGVHIRRTDKVGTEAAFHDIDEYMRHVNDRFDFYDLFYRRNVTRRIYLATDDSKLIDSARKQYPNYEILGDSSISLSAQLDKRYTDSSLSGIITDVYLLSKTDYLVCTFSSQVCRIAYEMMQQNEADMSSNFHSLDDFYYYGGQNEHNYIARRDHMTVMKKGDIMGVAGNHWNGDMMAKNKRTHIEKTYPAYKMEDIKKEVEFLGERN